jgi:hypothetical protein
VLDAPEAGLDGRHADAVVLNEKGAPTAAGRSFHLQHQRLDTRPKAQTKKLRFFAELLSACHRLFLNSEKTVFFFVIVSSLLFLLGGFIGGSSLRRDIDQRRNQNHTSDRQATRGHSRETGMTPCFFEA